MALAVSPPLARGISCAKCHQPAEVRGSSPRSRTQEGSHALPPHALRRSCAHQSTAPYPALPPALNDGVSAPEVFDDLWNSEPQFRHIWRVASVLWGVGLLTDAVLRVVMPYTLPIPVVPGLGGALWPVTFVLLQVVSNVHYHRAGLYRILGAAWLRPGESRSA